MLGNVNFKGLRETYCRQFFPSNFENTSAFQKVGMSRLMYFNFKHYFNTNKRKPWEREHFLEIFKIKVDEIYSALGSRWVPINWLGSYVLILLPS